MCENRKIKIFSAQEFILNIYDFIPTTNISPQVLLSLLISLYNGCAPATRESNGGCTYVCWTGTYQWRIFSMWKRHSCCTENDRLLFFFSPPPFSVSIIHQLPSLFDGRDNFMKPGLHDHAPTTITLTAAFTLSHGSCVHAPAARLSFFFLSLSLRRVT